MVAPLEAAAALEPVADGARDAEDVAPEYEVPEVTADDPAEVIADETAELIARLETAEAPGSELHAAAYSACASQRISSV